MIVTIDGPASAGKGTLSRALAERYGWAYFDTGMVYRAVGIQFIIDGRNTEDEDLAVKYARELTFAKMMELSEHREFRSSGNGENASVVALYPQVRAALLKMQQDFSVNPVFPDGTEAGGVVYDGRDTGTVVCPQADVKLFLTASLEARAGRRYKELLERGFDTSYETVYDDIKRRDKRDVSRPIVPLKPAPDSILLDSTRLTIEQMVEKACAIIDGKRKILLEK
jgi:cytidylate kinase